MHFSFIWKKYKYKQQNVLLVSKVKVLIMQTGIYQNNIFHWVRIVIQNYVHQLNVEAGKGSLTLTHLYRVYVMGSV